VRLLPKIFPLASDDALRRENDMEAERKLIHMEAKIGAELFGPIPKGHHREFFCLDEHTWIWHESWTEKGQSKSIDTRYEVRPSGVLKSQNGQTYQRLTSDEARNLYRAAELYGRRVDAEYQRMIQAAA
jgi:hypothetical protein